MDTVGVGCSAHRLHLVVGCAPLAAVAGEFTPARNTPGSVLSAAPSHAFGSRDFQAEEGESRDWGVPPFEPLSIRTADFDDVPVLDVPMTATAAPAIPVPTAELGNAPPLSMPLSTPIPTHVPTHVSTPAAAPEPPAAPAISAAETQRIVTVRVCAAGDSLWPGSALLAALADNAMQYGRYKVFHRTHEGRSLFCAASLVEPGTFDIARMPTELFRGVTLFAVLPGPADPLYAVDTLLATAQALSDCLQGAVQDSTGAPLSAQRAEALREDVAHWQNLQ